MNSIEDFELNHIKLIMARALRRKGFGYDFYAKSTLSGN